MSLSSPRRPGGEPDARGAATRPGPSSGYAPDQSLVRPWPEGPMPPRAPRQAAAASSIVASLWIGTASPARPGRGLRPPKSGSRTPEAGLA